MNKLVNKFYKHSSTILVIVLSLLAILTVLSPLLRSNTNPGIAIFYAILLPVSFFLGIYSKKTFKITSVLLIVGTIIGTITLVSMIATWSQYGLFHTLIYKNTPIYYFDGATYDVTKEVIFLSDFKFEVVTKEYAGLFGVLSGAFLPGAFFLNKKEKRNEFIAYILIGSVGVVALATVPNFKALIILALCSGLALLLHYFKKNEKVMKIIKYSLVALFALAVLFYLIAAINASLGFKFTGFLETLFVSNPIMRSVSDILNGMLLKDNGNLVNFFGLSPTYPISSVIEEIALTKSGVFEVELLKEVGCLGVILVLIFIAVVFLSFEKEFKKDNGDNFERITLVTLLMSFFVYLSLAFDPIPYIVNPEYKPFLRLVPLFVILFLLGMTCFTEEKKEETK